MKNDHNKKENIKKNMLKKETLTIKNSILILLNLFIIIDLIAITLVIFFDLPEREVTNILIFDLCICIFLLIEWIINFYHAESKLKEEDLI